MVVTQLRDRRQAMALIVVVVTMVVLVVMGVSLVRLASYENAAVNNYAAYIDARFTAWAGVERTIAVIQNQLRTDGFVDWEGILAYPADSNPDVLEASRDGDDLSLHEGIINGYSYSGQVGYRDPGPPARIFGRYEVGGNFYALKIEEQAGRLNVNSHISNGATNRKRSNTIMNSLLYTLANRCGLTTAQSTTAANALRPANDAVPGNYRYMDDIEEALAGIAESDEKRSFVNNLSTDSWRDTTTSGVMKTGGVASPPQYYEEDRAPVNINLVSRELLATLIEHVKATIVLHNATGSGYGTDQIGSFTFTTETTMGIVPTAVDIQFTASIANSVRDYLFNNYLGLSTPIRITDRSHLEEIIDNLPDNLFPSNAHGGWLDDTVWKQLWRDALKSNFNPNVIDSYWNPNGWTREPLESIAGKRMYFHIVKGDLYNRTQVEPPATPATPDPSTARSTELCFTSFGTVNVTCAAHVTANGGTLVAGQAVLFTKIKFGEQLTQTLQEDFGPATLTNPNIVSYPVVPTRTNQTGLTWDNVSGGLEPMPTLKPTSPVLASGEFRPDFTSNSVLPSSHHPVGKIYGDMDAQPLRSSLLNSLSHDGIVSRRAQVANDSDCPMFSVTANVPGGTDLRTYTGGNVGNYTGTIEFWVKLADGPLGIGTSPSTNRGIAYGLFSLTTISDILTPNQGETSMINGNDRREGMQMYAYINTIGELRISRLYYCVHWDTSIGKWRGATKAASGDPNRRIARRDAVVHNVGSALDWRPHEWHHLRVSWNDRTGGVGAGSDSLEVWVDGVLNTTPLEYSSVPGGFAVLNEKNPCDIFFINGFFRDQAKQGGYFHFVADNVPVYYPGNLTITGLRCFDGVREGGLIAKYPVSVSYANSFTLPGGEIYELGPLRWEAYPRARALGARVLCSSPADDPYPEPAFGDPGYYGEGVMPQSAGTIMRRGGDVIQYQASFITDLSLSGGIYRIVCPALESVTLMVYYRHPKQTEVLFN